MFDEDHFKTGDEFYVDEFRAVPITQLSAFNLAVGNGCHRSYGSRNVKYHFLYSVTVIQSSRSDTVRVPFGQHRTARATLGCAARRRAYYNRWNLSNPSHWRRRTLDRHDRWSAYTVLRHHRLKGITIAIWLYCNYISRWWSLEDGFPSE